MCVAVGCVIVGVIGVCGSVCGNGHDSGVCGSV